MLTSITNPRSLVLTLALSCFLSTAVLANGETPKAPPTHPAASRFHSQGPANGKKAHSRRLAPTGHTHGFHGWSAYCFFPKYHCYGYYSSVKGLWFYWYAPFNRYLPTSYLAIYPPTDIGIVPATIGAATVNLAAANQPTLPPDATVAPTQPPADGSISPDVKQAAQPQPQPMPQPMPMPEKE